MRQKLDERVAADGKNTISYYDVKWGFVASCTCKFRNTHIVIDMTAPKRTYINNGHVNLFQHKAANGFLWKNNKH